MNLYPPNILVICRIFTKYFTEYLSPAIELLLHLQPVTVVLFTLIASIFVEFHSPSLSQTSLWRTNLSLFEPYQYPTNLE